MSVTQTGLSKPIESNTFFPEIIQSKRPKKLPVGRLLKVYGLNCRFSHDVTTAMLVPLNKEKAAMLVPRPNPPGIELYYYALPFVFVEKHAC